MKVSTYTSWISQHAFISGILIALLLGILFQLLPLYWQLVILAGFVAGLVAKSWLRGFAAGFIGILLSWILYVTYAWTMFPTSRVVSTLSDIVGIPVPMLLGLVMLIASLLGGLGAAIGTSLLGITRTLR